MEERCFSFTSVSDRVLKIEETEFECNHEEADTRLIFHMSKLRINSKMVVEASDTDVLIILLGNIHKLKHSEIWLTSATSNLKDVSCVNCTSLSQNLGQDLCLALPGFHAFTGSDYTACFYRKGKIKPFELLHKNKHFQEIFKSLNNPNDTENELKMQVLQEFTCKLCIWYKKLQKT